MTASGNDIDEVLAGFFVYDCAIRSCDCFSFLLLESVGDAASGDQRLMNIFINRPIEERLAWDTYSGFDLPKIAASSQPKNQAVMVSMSCDVAVIGGGKRDTEDPIPNGGPPET
ncbi:hypothetical protein, partial [Enterococcus faecium]|uniref:hypothetical protein n=2 Tax=Bacteria TaxID=2 RepID=UPI00164F100F